MKVIMHSKEQQVNDVLPADPDDVEPMDPANFTDRLDHFVPDKG